jgi:2-keto-4-pentenoate hydratase/2-oxohepta-3-ene-1,7-dioic acid hydratase in catechol pathway
MTHRRTFLKSASASGAGLAAGVGLALASPGTKAHADPEHARKPRAHSMVRGKRIVSILQPDGRETMGIVFPEGVLDVRAAAKALKLHAPMTLDHLLQDSLADELDGLIAQATSARFPLLSESSITHGRLFRNPGKIICVGLNYRAHADEVGAKHPVVPPLFNKFNNSLAAHNGVLKLPEPEISTKFDYETELLIVVGRPMRNVAEADTLSHVAGYCTANDFSSRDLQLELPSVQWMIGKTLDQYAPIGPYFVSADLVGDPNSLGIRTYVNGELRQNSNTSDFIHNTQKMLAYISKHWTLDPGDIIFTGTPQGVIAGMPKDRQVWLKKGDVIVSSIEKLGELKFTLG